MESDGRISILLVDDKPDKLLSLEAVLSDLKQDLVRAYSGREALRKLLVQDFAVILLDVNMPGMDGFETAALIRQRKNSAHTPIIFVTAYVDELHMARGYSLGAVDYILTPVIPEVLQTKVAVFVDLFKKSEQVRRQAASLEQRAVQLHKLTAASLAINAALSLDKMLRVVADTARDVIGTHQAIVAANLNGSWSRPRVAAAYSEKFSQWSERDLRPDDQGIYSLLSPAAKSVRFTQAELEARLNGQLGKYGRPDGAPAPRGWIAAPLTTRDGRQIGLIEASDRYEGEFTAEDEAVLVQLAQMTSIAIENTIYAEAREANRLKDEFLATLSHELRTPLNAILGWTQLLRTPNVGQDDIGHGLEVIERNVKAQTKLIEDLLDVSRITTGKLRLSIRPTPLSPLVESALDSVRPAAEARGVQLERSISPGPDEIAGDLDRLQQVVWNLLTNAINFTPKGGCVRLSLDRTPTHATISVSDTGRGISPEFLPYVFDRFRQADSSTTRSHGGLGIGLTIVRHIVELHGGTVHADSEGEGRGATFRVELPFAVQHEAPAPAPVKPAAESPAKVFDQLPDLAGLDVLIVDDEADARELVGLLLGRCKAKVTAAASADEVLGLLDHIRPNVLVSDIGMPGTDGFELIRIIRGRDASRGGTVPAIALTAYVREEDRARTLSAGFQAHVPKPVDAAELVCAVASLAGRSVNPSAPSLKTV